MANVIAKIEQRRRELPQVNRAALCGNIAPALKNYNEITGHRFHRSLLYRQAGRDDYHQPSFLERLFVLFCAVSFTPKRVGGQVLLDEVASWEAFHREAGCEMFRRRRDFLAVEQEINCLSAERGRAFYTGDFASAYRLTLEIKKREQEILDLIRAESDGMLFMPER